MEQTTENKNLSSERKDPEVEEGGIRRRLRDRDLLKKRKAEAEEKANQAESRKKERREERSSTGKKGRPRKINPPTEVQVAQKETPRMDILAPVVETEPLTTIQTAPPDFVEIPLVAEPVPGPDLLPVPVPVPAPVSLVLSAPAPLVLSAPAAVPVPAPASSSAVTTSTGSAEKVLIEDLGPDEEEDLPQAPGGPSISEDEELSANVPEQDKTFSYPLFVSPSLQQEYFPGNFI